jgi:glycosyltransferase involved in cell wall biosynthesis
METILTAFLGLIALAWLAAAVEAAQGARRIPRLDAVPPLAGPALPRVSILFTACNEEEKLPGALATMLALDYPDYEIIAVNDRSTDATGAILDRAAQRDPRLRVIHNGALPPGWLGKTHALHRAAEAATGEWLVFTDADVHFAPDLLRRTVALATERGWDHLALLPSVVLHSFWEKVLMTYFELGLVLLLKPWKVADPKSKRFMGGGTFQLLRREVHRALGGHRRLAMEVVDDLKLGKLVKLGGYRSGVVFGDGRVRVRWHAGVRNIIRGTEKNFFSGADFSVAKVFAQTAALFFGSIFPLLILPFADGPARVAASVAVALPMLMHGYVARIERLSALYGLTHPAGAVLFAWMLVRSTALTLRRGGIEWRGTFYPLDDLRKGLV